MGLTLFATFAGSRVNLDKDTQKIWEFVLSTAMMSEMKVLSFSEDANLIQERASETLKLGIKYKNSAHVLNGVADFLDFCFRYVFLGFLLLFQDIFLLLCLSINISLFRMHLMY